MCAGVDFEFNEDEHRQVSLRIIGMYEGLHPDTAQRILEVLNDELQHPFAVVNQDSTSLTVRLFSTAQKQRVPISKAILAALKEKTSWELVREHW
jgi:hypothetical protein